jgi:phosphohistidine phosphatase SixA
MKSSSCLLSPHARRILLKAASLGLTGLAHLDASATGEAQAVKQSLQHFDAASEFLMMRHADAPGYSDPANMSLSDCKTQRNLGPSGRQQAQHVGDSLRQRGIKKATVWSSPWCRCIDTASLLGFDPPILKDFLGSFFVQRERSVSQTETLASSLVSWFATKPGTALILVTHQVNIAAYTGQTTASGEVLRIQTQKNGKPESYRRVFD